jgi:hypothetical protein
MIALACALALAAVVLVLWWPAENATEPPAVSSAPAAAPSASAEMPPDVEAPANTPSVASPPPAPAASEMLEDLTDPGSAWASVDMDEVRAAMPDNLYWKMGMPTNDPDVIREREAERARWNVQYGKVLSNTATEQEIRDYYALRYRLSSEYIEFASYLLDHYREDIPERDVGLLELAVELHLARLEEIPGQQADAFERKRKHDAAREAWLADQARFEAGQHATSDHPTE